MKTKEQWTDEVLNSLDGMARAGASAELRQKILAKLSALPPRRIPLVTRRTIWLMAAGLLLLLGTNLYAVQKAAELRGEAAVAGRTGGNPIGNEYFAPSPSI